MSIEQSAAMSDKTKYYADQALIGRKMDEQRIKDAANPPPDLRCPCGAPALLASHDKHNQVTFYCADCAPADLMAAYQASN